MYEGLMSVTFLISNFFLLTSNFDVNYRVCMRAHERVRHKCVCI